MAEDTSNLVECWKQTQTHTRTSLGPWPHPSPPCSLAIVGLDGNAAEKINNQETRAQHQSREQMCASQPAHIYANLEIKQWQQREEEHPLFF